jgi:hypothetical protein
VGNSVSEPNGGVAPPVGGLFNEFAGSVVAANSILAAQTGGPICSGLSAGSDAGYNIDVGWSCGFGGASHSLSNTDPLLDPTGLRDNGGPNGMETIALGPGSPAIDAIPLGANGCGTSVAIDERGVPRPQGRGCDIGAFEAIADVTPPIIEVPGSITVNATVPGSAMVTYVVSASDPDDPVASLVCSPASGSIFPVGATTVSCIASDTRGNVGSAVFVVTVKGAAAQLVDLLAAATAAGPGTSLADKIARAQAYLARNDVVDACTTLGAFVNEVKAQTGKSVPAGRASTLIAAAQRIRTVLGC